MTEIAKVTAIVTRLGDHGPELCVFDHPLAGTQLPDGSLEEGEEATVGAARELFEETGLDGAALRGVLASVPAVGPGFAVVRQATTTDDGPLSRGIGVRVIERGSRRATVVSEGRRFEVPTDCLSLDAVRHLVHFVALRPAPDEWWVVTLDGGGLSWRCRWLPISQLGAVDEAQQQWVAAVRGDLEEADHPAAARRAQVAGAYELFFAPPWSGDHVAVSWKTVSEAGPKAAAARAEAAAFNDHGSLVAVQEADAAEGAWTFPGGRREPGEAIEQTLQREVMEEACAEVVDHELLGYQHFVSLDEDGQSEGRLDAIYWARAGSSPSNPGTRQPNGVCLSLRRPGACRSGPTRW